MINYKIIFVLLLLFPFSVSAASGCCSHHGGVDCSKIQSNGKVVCNDGWTGSSCSYSGMVKCQGYSPSTDDSEEIYDEESYSSDSSSSDGLLALLGIGGVAWAVSALKKGV